MRKNLAYKDEIFWQCTLKKINEENRDVMDNFGENRKRIDIFFRFLSSFEVLDPKF